MYYSDINPNGIEITNEGLRPVRRAKTLKERLFHFFQSLLLGYLFCIIVLCMVFIMALIRARILP